MTISFKICFNVNLVLTAWLLFLHHSPVTAQSGTLNFRHLNTSNGLSDPVVRSISRDKYGYLWLGTQNGLNRFNGYEVKIFQHRDNDSFSLPDHNVPYLFCDSSGELWVSQLKGLHKFEYSTGRFLMVPRSDSIVTAKMVQTGPQTIFLSTSRGMMEHDLKSGNFSYLSDYVSGDDKDLLSVYVNDFCLNHKSEILIACDSGLVIYDTKSKTVRKQKVPYIAEAITKIAADKSGNYWMVTYDTEGVLLLRTDTAFKKHEVYRSFNRKKTNHGDNQIIAVFTDKSGRVWFTSIRQGIALYDPQSNDFIFHNHDPLQSGSVGTNFLTILYEDRNGFIWAGTEGNGAEYFHPEKNLFHAIQPSMQTPTLPDKWCRTACEDDDGNLWMGTVAGVAKYNVKTHRYSIIQNAPGRPRLLHINSTRSLLCVGDDVWIGTIIGLNRYNRKTGKMEFLDAEDSIPHSFYWSIVKDHNNDIWFGCNDGLLRYNRKKGKPEPLTRDKLFGAYASMGVRSIFEDSKHRLWIGLTSRGLLVVNPERTRVRFIDYTEKNKRGLKDGTVTSIAEDSTGVIWISTLSGFASYNIRLNSFKHYPGKDSSVTQITSSLMCDAKNRLWIAASSGIYMLDPSRSLYKSFGIDDGLPTIDFSGQIAYKAKNGSFMYPSLKGFVVFNPEEYVETKDHINVYLSSFKIFGNEINLHSDIEQVEKINLKHDENFFALQMTAINYDNPNQNWYAHKLEPFDKDWIYSQERNVNYTNVPGGNYTFYYKTTTDPNNWNAPAKSIRISIDTVFYRTWWFGAFAVLLIAMGFYAVYKYRIHHNQKWLRLENKANSLEKEKALAMYESLKQQLNPHFLFNSLTSLSSLISSNPANAKKFLDSLSKIYRYILKSRDHETVPLADEIKLAEIYMQLQQTRFREGLQFNVNIPEEYLHQKIAPVTLQNLIENAMKHNIIDADSPLVISIYIDNGWLAVKNNLQKKTFVETSNKQGLKQMRSLYSYLTGKDIAISEDNQYFTIKIPLA